jgi:hypothetical protein
METPSTPAYTAYLELAKKLQSEGWPLTLSAMFGMPSIKKGKKGVAGYYENEMVFKLTGEANLEAMHLPGARYFDPMGGRPMKNWILLPLEQQAHWEKFLKIAYDQVEA